jgi:hypothetical protein
MRKCRLILARVMAGLCAFLKLPIRFCLPCGEANTNERWFKLWFNVVVTDSLAANKFVEFEPDV